MRKISGSFLSLKEDEKEIIERFNESNLDYIHFDIMDGSMTPNVHIMPKEVSSYLKLCKKDVDVHLMVNDPFDYFPYILDNNSVKMVAIHSEIPYVNSYINLIKSKNKKVGIALKSDSSIEILDSLYRKIDYVLLLSVPLGKSGQEISKNIKDKIMYLKILKKEYKYSFDIFVDGGINDTTLSYVSDADCIICGSFLQTDIDEKIKLLKK